MNKYAFIALPGLKSKRFIKLVDRAIISVFTIISIMSFDIATETISPTNPPNKALKPPVVRLPLNKLLKCPFKPLTSLFPMTSSSIPAKTWISYQT